MPLPDDVPTFTLVGAFPPLAPDGADRVGDLTFTPVPPVLLSPDGVYLGSESATLVDGAFAKELVANDAFDTPFVWRVDGRIDGQVPFSWNISVPASAGTVRLGTVAIVQAPNTDYVVVPGPAGPQGQAVALDVTDARYGRLASPNVWTGTQSLGSATPEKTTDVTISSAGRPLFVKTVSTYDHALTTYLAGNQTPAPSGGGGYNPTQHNNSALNVVSENSINSAVFLSGVETARGTLKIAHKGYADGGDSGAAAISIDLQTDYNTPGDTSAVVAGTKGTKARGVFITSTTDASATGVLGDAVVVRFTTGLDDFRVTGAGRTILGSPIGTTPLGRLDVRQADDATVGLFLKANSATASDLVQIQDSTGALRLNVDKTGQLVARRNLYATLGIQVGGTSATFGGGAGVLGFTDATTVPTTNPAGGLVAYSQSGVLKYRQPSGAVVTLDGSASSDVRPVRQGLLGWSMDSAAAVNGSAVTAGQEVLVRVVAETAGAAGHVTLGLTNVPAGCANVFVGLRDATGALLGSSVDVSASVNGAAVGKLTLALASGVAVTAGATYYVVTLVGSGTTLPSLSRGASNSVLNDGLSAGSYRTMTAGSSLTALPSSVTMASAGQSSTAFYASIAA